MTGLFLFLGVILIGLGGASIYARSVDKHGLKDGALRACSRTTNCVVTETDTASFEALSEVDANTWEALKTAIQAQGGEIQEASDVYLWATFTTPLLRFVDDLEARLDAESQQIHLRSASRVGRSDFGANRKRLNNLVAELAK